VKRLESFDRLEFEGNHHDTNPDWDAVLPDVDAETSGSAGTTRQSVVKRFVTSWSAGSHTSRHWAVGSVKMTLTLVKTASA
jgi:hypothetical protein